MEKQFRNLVFSGGGVLGISYLGMLASLYERNLIEQVDRMAGSSAGAITACIVSFNIPFEEAKTIVGSLDYSKIPGKDEILIPRYFSRYAKGQLNKIFGNIDCVYRLIKQYGWYSSSYVYSWIQAQIATQFDIAKKSPPYTFADFHNTSIHKDHRSFKDLYIIGTDISNNTSSVFSYRSTPNMEVAEAVRISMSIPLFFEAIKASPTYTDRDSPRVYSDGGLMYLYPINLFDEDGPPSETLGALFRNKRPPSPINNLLDFIGNVLACTTIIQSQVYFNTPDVMARSIQIETGDVSSLDFNIKTGDTIYEFLINQGYIATENFFSSF